MEINELVKKVKADNDEEAFNEIVNLYRPMIYAFIHANHLEYGDYAVCRDDLFQEGLIALHEACKLFKDDRGACFHTFAHLVVQRRIKRFFLQNYRHYKHEAFSIDAVAEGMTYANIASEKIADNPDSAYRKKVNEHAARACFAKLSPKEQDIVRLRSEKRSYKQIAIDLKVSEKAIDNTIQKVRKNYKKLKDLY